MSTFRKSMIDSDSTSNHVEKPTQATIKKDVAVASTYEVKIPQKELKEEFGGLAIKGHETPKGNLVIDSWLDKALWKHLGSYFTYIPTSHARFVRKAKVAGFKQILTKGGIALELRVSNY